MFQLNINLIELPIITTKKITLTHPNMQFQTTFTAHFQLQFTRTLNIDIIIK